MSEDQNPADQPEGATNQPDSTVVEETHTTTTQEPGQEPSTAAQDVVDEVHDQQAEGSTTVVEESTRTETTQPTEGPQTD